MYELTAMRQEVMRALNSHRYQDNAS